MQVQLEKAGKPFYAKAGTGNWSSVRSLIDAGNSYIQENLAILTANDNMPPTFATQFAAARKECIEFSKAYFAADEAKTVAVGTKKNANEIVYSSLMEMLGDAQSIFADNKLMKHQFVFNYRVARTKGSRPARFKGYLTNADTGLPLAGVSISSANGKYTATTNEKGYFDIGQLAGDDYTFVFEKTGYDTLKQDFVIKTGKSSTVQLSLTAQENMLKVA